MSEKVIGCGRALYLCFFSPGVTRPLCFFFCFSFWFDGSVNGEDPILFEEMIIYICCVYLNDSNPEILCSKVSLPSTILTRV